MTNQLTIRNNYIDMMINQYNSIQDENMKRQIMRLLQNAFNNYIKYTPLPRSMSRIDINHNLSNEVSISRPIRTMHIPSRNNENNELVLFTEPRYSSSSRNCFSPDDFFLDYEAHMDYLWHTRLFNAFRAYPTGTFYYSFSLNPEENYLPSGGIFHSLSK